MTEPAQPEGGDGDRTIPRHDVGADARPTSPASGPPRIPGVELGAEIARGGMGVVYRGEQPYLARTVAVKVLANYLAGEEFVRRFQREARILAGISHSHIVGCFDAGVTEDGRCYLVMEFVDGPTLRAHCDRNGALAVPEALRVVRDIAGALAHAHAAGIIHRDVKPENILLQRDDRRPDFPFVPKLVDLGLARRSEIDQDVTAPGVVMGTTSTMAPEQFDDPDHVDFRVDLYGLGCVAYHVLTGKPAFGGGPLTQTMAQKAEPLGPDPRERNPQVPPEIADLVRRLLANSAADRPADYDEVIDTCVRVLGSAGERTATRVGTAAFRTAGWMPAGAQQHAAGRRRRRILGMALVGVFVLGGLGLLAARWWPAGPPSPVTTEPTRAPEPAVGGPATSPPIEPVPTAPAPPTATNGNAASPPPTPVPPPTPAEPVPSPAFAHDLAAAGWTVAQPDGMQSRAAAFDGEKLILDCQRGEATCGAVLAADTALVGAVALKPAWHERAEQRAAGIRLLPAGAAPLVLWLTPNGDGGIRASLGSAPAGEWPPTALRSGGADPKPCAVDVGRGGRVEFAIERRDGKLSVRFGRNLEDTADLEGASIPFAVGDCRVEAFVRDGTAWLENFTWYR